FVFRSFKGWALEDRGNLSDSDLAALLQLGRTVVPVGKKVLFGSFYPPLPDYASVESVVAIRFGLLISAPDWKRNQSTYEAMMAYVRSHQYYARPDFRHTLFLSTGDFHGNFSVMVPFHDSWIDHTEP